MEATIRLGSIYGIKIGLHYSWLIIAVLIVLSLSSYFSQAHPDWSSGTIWLMAIFSALFFFTAIIIHELSHAAVALSKNLPVRSITLFALGGVAQIEKESPDAKTEFWIGIVGPITSGLIGFVCLGIAYLLGWTPMSEAETPIMAMLVWLGYINIALAVFNMIPGFPMDGGRVLRGIIWAVTGDGPKSTRIASVSGQIMAFGFIILGLFMFFSGAGFGGLWIAFIGWFLLNAAKATYAQVEVTEGLKGVLVGDLMTRDCPVLDRYDNLQAIVDEYLLKTGQRCFMVTDDSGPIGMITPHEIKAVERRLWPFKTASDAMRPLESLHVIRPQTKAAEALEIIGREGVNQLPVITDGKLEGIISRERIINYLFTRRELDV
jgi:Zn-dependent protease/predicted transcriptional regulator